MRLPFELSPQIIYRIIYSQADSIGKAVIELLMNTRFNEVQNIRLVQEGLCPPLGNWSMEEYPNWRSGQEDDLC
jgi:hypothetical protein